jgi:hypothetical protein
MSEEMIEKGKDEIVEEQPTRIETREEAAAAINKKHGLEGADLSGLDLSQMKITGLNAEGINLSDTDLSQAVIAALNLEDVNFANAQLTQAKISAANLENANFRGAQLQGAVISGVNLESGDFTGADLSDSKWFGVNVEDADFSDAVTTGARSAAVSWSSAKVPPKEMPEPISPPSWLPALFAALVVLVVGILILAKKRAQMNVEVD